MMTRDEVEHVYEATLEALAPTTPLIGDAHDSALLAVAAEAARRERADVVAFANAAPGGRRWSADGPEEPDECDHCGNAMDGYVASTSEVCFDCWSVTKRAKVDLATALGAPPGESWDALLGRVRGMVEMAKQAESAYRSGHNLGAEAAFVRALGEKP